MEHKGWNRRGYLPHCDFAGNLQAITFRLADSLPAHVLEKWRQEFERDRTSEDLNVRRRAETGLHRRLTSLEDAGHGSCLLREPTNAEMVQRILIEGHKSAYRLIEWCVMPNHVHVMIQEYEGYPLAVVIKRWKGVSGMQINRLVGREGRLWMPDYHDRLIRDENHFYDARAYIRNNPVKARLCENPEDWAYSSCGIRWTPNGEG
jgi:putative transposase